MYIVFVFVYTVCEYKLKWISMWITFNLMYVFLKGANMDKIRFNDLLMGGITTQSTTFQYLILGF